MPTTRTTLTVDPRGALCLGTHTIFLADATHGDVIGTPTQSEAQTLTELCALGYKDPSVYRDGREYMAGYLDTEIDADGEYQITFVAL